MVVTPRLCKQSVPRSTFNATLCFRLAAGRVYVAIQASFKDPHTGQTVVATSHPTNSTTTAQNATAWTIDFPPQIASLNPVDIALTTSMGSGEPITLTNCLFGDVFLCAGQVRRDRIDNVVVQPCCTRITLCHVSSIARDQC